MRRRVIVSALSSLLFVFGASPAFGDGGKEEREAASSPLEGVNLCLPKGETRKACPIQQSEPGDRVSSALVSLPDPEEAARERQDWTLPLFGSRVCLGEVSPGAACDVRIPPLLPDLDAEMMAYGPHARL